MSRSLSGVWPYRSRKSMMSGQLGCRGGTRLVMPRGRVGMRPRDFGTIAAVALFLAAAGSAFSRAQPDKPLDRSVLAVGSKVAGWQLSHLDSFDYIPAGSHRQSTEGRRDWIQAAFYIGLTRFADVTGDARYATAVLEHGTAEEWG